MSIEDARARFAAFPADLRAVMKAAGAVERWSSLQWQQETVLVADLIEANHYAPPFIGALVSVYHVAAGGARSDAMTTGATHAAP